jgi:dolichol-phosphate mannosyltransferase
MTPPSALEPPQPPDHPRAPLIIIPTYNERENLPQIIPAIQAEVPRAHILIVDDNSPDGTGDLADDLAAADPRVHVLHRAGKQGLGKAYVAGFRWALDRADAPCFDPIIEMDADFSHPPQYLPTLLNLSASYDVVVGSRYVQGGYTQDWGWLRRAISRGGGLYARAILGVRVQDLTAGFVCWRRHALSILPLDDLHASGYAFQIEMKYQAIQHGLRVIEAPIHFPDRRVGTSKMSPKIAAEALWTVWQIRR